MVFLSKKYIGIYLFIFIMLGCANTGKMNFENNWNYYVATGKHSINKLVKVRKQDKDYVGKEVIQKHKKLIRYHFKFKGNPKLEPCYYYVDVDYKTKRLLSWGV